MLDITEPQRTRLSLSTADGPLKMVVISYDREVRKGNIPSIARSDRGRAIELSLQLLRRYAEVEVSAVITFLPHHLIVSLDHTASVVTSIRLDRTRLSARCDGGTSEFDTNGTLARLHIVLLLLEPDEVRDPILVAITGEENVIVDVVIVKVLKRAVAVGDVSIPVIATKRALIVLEDAGDDDLIAYKTPGSTAISRLGERVVEPVLLTSTHEGTAGIIANEINVVVVPAKTSDRAVINTSVKDNEIKKFAHLERAPDAKAVVKIGLTDRHPLKVGSHSVDFARVDADLWAIVEERVFGIVQTTSAVSVNIVGNLVIIPSGNPCVLLGQMLQIGVGTVLFCINATFSEVLGRGINYLAVASTVVIKTENLVGRDRDTLSRILFYLVLVDVITQVQYPIMLILASSVAIGIEVAFGCNRLLAFNI